MLGKAGPGGAGSQGCTGRASANSGLLACPPRRYVVPFVLAADAVGAGACVSLAVLDPAGAVLASRRVHTGGGAVVEGVRPGGVAAKGSAGLGHYHSFHRVLQST